MPTGIVNKSRNSFQYDIATCSFPLAPHEQAVITGKRSPLCSPFRVVPEGNLARTRQSKETLREAFEELVNTARPARHIAQKHGLTLDR
eukprot:9126237-Karenia_brevis.AAC.1